MIFTLLHGERNLRKITLVFLVGIAISFQCLGQHQYGSFYTGDAFVNYVLPENRTEKAAIVMIPGANLSSYIYITTPDGRREWSDLFADHGYDAYMVNDPRYDFATGGIVDPYMVPSGGKEPTPGSEQGWQRDIWRRWGFGESQGNPYPDALFPTDDFDNFAENYPYLGDSDQSYADAIQSVIDSTKTSVWLLAHSAGASRAVSVARERPDLVRGLILLEPAGPPDAEDFPDLNGLHMFGVYGDYIVSRNQTNRKMATEAAADLFSNAGGVADVVSLPEDYLVNGNSHMLMQDRNSREVFEIIELWLRQFSDPIVQVDGVQEPEISLSPNPVINRLRVEGIIKGDYKIYSADGRILKKGTLKKSEIDVSDLANGMMLLQIDLVDRRVIRKFVKSGG